jgi:hypothetical protein
VQENEKKELLASISFLGRRGDGKPINKGVSRALAKLTGTI